MDWSQFVMNLDSLDPADVEAAFLRLGACSVTLSDAGDDPVLEPGPGETPLWSNTRITGLFPGDADMDIFRAALQNELGLDCLPAHDIETLADRAWEREWLRDFGPKQFGRRLWICPSGLQEPGGEAVVVRLDPGLAFGTGTHPTTAMCLEWLDGISLDGKSVLDYGCGSGILAIAALEAGIEGKFDVVVANILAGPLVRFADSITARLARGGMLALSGVLCEQVHEVRAAYAHRIAFDEPAFREQAGQTWSRLTGKRRD
jgi:ribosomal protein L11 methyltransferase